MSQNRTIRIFTAFIFVSMLLGANVLDKLWTAPNLVVVFKQLGLMVVLALMAFGSALFLVKVLKVKINPR